MGGFIRFLIVSAVLGIAGEALSEDYDPPFDDSPAGFDFPLPVTPRLLPISKPMPFNVENVGEIFERDTSSLISYVDARKFLDETLGDIVGITKYRGRLNINNYYDSSKLNLYFLSSDQLQTLESGVRVCAFLPPRPLIVCDSEFLRTQALELVAGERYHKAVMIQKLKDGSIAELPKSKMAPDLRDITNFRLAAGFLGWVIAHEVGHAELHADERIGHLFFNGTASGKLEREADERAGEIILQSDDLANMVLLSMDELIEKRFSEYGVDGRHNAVVVDPETRWASHRYRVEFDAAIPEELLVYRASSIYRYVAARHPNRDTTGYISKVVDNVVLVNPTWRLFLPNFVERWIDQ